MDLNLTGKTVVITGGATGIGRAAAWEFLREGANVAVLGRRLEPLEEFAREVEQEGFKLCYESCDVTDPERVEGYARRVREKFGSLDVWVNNAGIGINKPFLDFTREDWDQISAINLRAVIDCTQIAARIMKDQGGGVILNASSFCATSSIFALTSAERPSASKNAGITPILMPETPSSRFAVKSTVQGWDVQSSGSCPAMAFMASAASSTVRANGPT